MRNGPLRFDPFEFDPQTLELFRQGERLHLQRQPALVLKHLLEHAGELVTREDLQLRIWGRDRHVDLDRSLAYCLRQIRAALGDDANDPRFVQTLRGVGYRFVGQMGGPLEVASTRPPASRPNPRLLVAAVCAIAILAASAGDRAIAPSLPVPIARVPIDQDVIVRRADAYLRRQSIGDSRTAFTMYRSVLASSPGHVRALSGAAQAAADLALHHRELRLGHVALEYASAATSLAPNDADVLTARARALHAAGHLVDATAAYERAMRHTTTPDLLDAFAIVLYQRGQIDHAIRVLVDRWRRFEPHPAPASLIATALGALGFGAESRDWSDLALDLSPDNGQSQYLEGLKAFRAGRLEEARTWISPLVERPDPGTLVLTLASQIDAQARGPAAAIPRLLAAVDAAPDAYETRATLAAAYHSAGQIEAATRERSRVIETCRAAAQAAPQSAFWARCLASALAESGSRHEAAEWYARAVSLGWRRPALDGLDASIRLLGQLPQFVVAQRRMVDDVERMRAEVVRFGVPDAPMIGRR